MLLDFLEILLPLFISYRSSWQKLIKKSSKFILYDHVPNSHDHSVLQSINITRGNLMLVILRALKRVNGHPDQ